MKVEKNKLHQANGEKIPFIKSPRIGGKLQPRYMVIHFTVGQSASAAVAWLTRKSPGPSAHLVIGRDGSTTQLVPFDQVAFHAGPSKWGELEGMDQYSIGIELDNAGPMIVDQNRWVSKFKRVYSEEEIFKGPHKNGGSYMAWHTYPEEQIETLVRVARALVVEYDIEDILGHDDISPGRKWDPGPAFPMEEVKRRVFEKPKIDLQRQKNDSKEGSTEFE